MVVVRLAVMWRAVVMVVGGFLPAASATGGGDTGGGGHDSLDRWWPASVVAFWDFQQATEVAPGVFEWHDLVAGYTLQQYNASWPVQRSSSGNGTSGPANPLGNYSAEFRHGQRLEAPRTSVPTVASIAGPNATVTVVAWVQLLDPLQGGSYVGGVWQENTAARQFALFLDGTGGCPVKDGLVAHVSAEGGPSPGEQYCRSRACGATTLAPGAWHCLANVYDGAAIRAFVNGTLDDAGGSNSGGNDDSRGGTTAAADDGDHRWQHGPQHATPLHNDRDNPFLYPNPPAFPNGGIFDPPNSTAGASLALGANLIHIGGGVGPGVLGNRFAGRIGGFAVANAPLSSDDLLALCAGPPPAPPPPPPHRRHHAR